MMFYPIFLNIRGRPVVVAGGGKVAERKVESLLEHGALVTVISPRVTSRLQALADSNAIRLDQRPYEAGDCRGALLVFSATDDRAVNGAVWEDARKEGVPVNTADEPEQCDFIMPAVVRQGGLTVAISTGGASPALAARLGQQLSRLFGPEYGRLLEVLREIRPDIRSRFQDSEKRKDIHYRILDSDILGLIRNRDAQAVHERLQQIMDEFECHGEAR